MPTCWLVTGDWCQTLAVHGRTRIRLVRLVMSGRTSKRYAVELLERAVQMVEEIRGDHESQGHQ